jgi:hypothetical protein
MNRIALCCSAALGLLSGCAIDPTPTKDEVRQIQNMPKPSSTQDAAVAWLQENLKDPDSARYRGFRPPVAGVLALPNLNARGGQDFEHFGSTRRAGWFMCGQVNAKNSYGGYTGFEPFMVYFSPADPSIVTDGWIGDIVGDWCRGLYGY